MATGMEPPDHLTEVIGLCRKRVCRAEDKVCAAGAEHREATAALEAAKKRLADWIEQHPDPQGSLLEGLTNV